MKKTILWFVVFLLLQAASLAAQPAAPMPDWQRAAGGKLEFEVASVRPVEAGHDETGNVDLESSEFFRYAGGLIRTSGNLLGYLGFAYKIQDTSQIPLLYKQLPKWAQEESFTVEARAPIEKPTKDQIRLMMQSLLAERFGLRMRTEIQVQPVYTLTLVTPGKPGLQQHPEDDKLCTNPGAEHPHAKGDPSPPACMLIYFDLPGNLLHLRMMDYTMAEIAGQLASPVVSLGRLDARPVVDQTGLTGHFDLNVEFARPPKANAAIGGEAAEPGATFLDALKRQAGLELLKSTAPVPIYAIDAVHEPTPN